MTARWLDQFRGLGAAALDLLRAEASALAGDLKGSGRRLAWAVLLLVASLTAAFWAVAALVYGLVEVLAGWLPRWAAALSIGGLFLLLSAALAWWARRRMRAIELPADTVRRRLADSSDWWQERVVEGSRRLESGSEEP